jgi:hypothetical protein
VAALQPQSQAEILIQRGEESRTLKVLVAQRPKPVQPHEGSTGR